MKKISLLILLATFSFADKIPCLYVISQTEPFCITKISYNTSLLEYTFRKNNTASVNFFSSLNNPTIMTGYSFDTITKTFELDPQYAQLDVSHFQTQHETLKNYLDNPPLPNTELEPTDPEPNEPDPTPTQPEPDENEPEPIPSNPTNIYKYGLTFNEFNFLSGATGLICAFLISSSIIRKF